MCAHIFAYVHMEAVPTQEVTKKGNAFARTKKNCIHVGRRGGREARVRLPPLPLYSIGRLIFYSGRSRICICSGAPFPVCSPFSPSLSSSPGTRASVWDMIRMMLLLLQSGEAESASQFNMHVSIL